RSLRAKGREKAHRQDFETGCAGATPTIVQSRLGYIRPYPAKIGRGEPAAEDEDGQGHRLLGHHLDSVCLRCRYRRWPEAARSFLLGGLELPVSAHAHPVAADPPQPGTAPAAPRLGRAGGRRAALAVRVL